MKKARVFASLMAAMLLITSCTKTTTDETSVESTSIETTVTEASATENAPEFSIDALKELDGVVSVEEIEFQTNIPDLASTDDYILCVVFEQPLDWNDPTKGTFQQRVQVCYSEKNRNNKLFIGGYMLTDEDIAAGSYNDVYALKNEMNLVRIEYRFFGKSAPEGLSINDPANWEYMTSYNAACDFHHVITELKKVLPGSWLMEGRSKGGTATMVQSMYFPEDADIFIAAVAPVMGSTQEDGLFENLYETIGNEMYGEQQAAEYRQLVLDFQVEAIKLRDQLQDRIYENSLLLDGSYSEFVTPEIIYDYRVLSFGVTMWQYDQSFEKISYVLESKGEEDYIDKFYNLLSDPRGSNVTEKTGSNDLSPFWIQCLSELGYFRADFSYLRQALEEDGSGAKLYVTEDMEDMFYFKTILEPDMIEAFTFDTSLSEDLINWSNTTSSNVILLYGNADVWYPLRLPDVPDRDNFHTFVADASHACTIYKLEPAELKEVMQLIDEAMGN